MTSGALSLHSRAVLRGRCRKPSERFIKARQQTVANGLLQKCHASAHEDTSSRTSSSTNLSEDMGGSVLSSSASGNTLRLRNNRLATLSDAGAHGSVAGSSVAPLSGSSASLSSNGTPTVDGLITGMGDGASYISSRHFHVDAHGRPMVLHGRQSLGGADSRPRVSVHEDELEAISSFPDSDAVAHGDDTAARKAERALRAQLQAADRQVNSLTRAAVARASIATARKLAALGATPAHGAMAGRAGAIPTLDADMGASSSQSVRTAAPAPVVAGVLPPASEATFEIADHSTP
ncbi:hypothetical protein EON67_00100 [archaeon]|nr:MAG: hypothetical protein EON67_00100 [archaeon]